MYVVKLPRNKETKKKAKVIDHTFDYAEELLRNKFRTKAKISKNKLTLSFSDVADLNRILEMMDCLEESSMEVANV